MGTVVLGRRLMHTFVVVAGQRRPEPSASLEDETPPGMVLPDPSGGLARAAIRTENAEIGPAGGKDGAQHVGVRL